MTGFSALDQNRHLLLPAPSKPLIPALSALRHFGCTLELINLNIENLKLNPQYIKSRRANLLTFLKFCIKIIK